MTSRKKKKSTNKTSTTLALLCLMALVVGAWQLYESGIEEAQSQREEENRLQSSANELQAVKIPAGLKSQLLSYPGFVVSFNPEYHQPNYVAWELTGDESTSTVVAKRTDNFAPDPTVKGCPTLADYQNSGYDRGHMAPAADMKWSLEAMNACFLLTNMSPQHHALNSGSWNTLEDKCRQWAQRDSAIIIVCGPVLTDVLTRYIGETRVAVPERYFKVILAPYADPPRGIGFVMPNSKVNGGMQACAMSIDEVEAITGYDFFAALPDDVEEKIEAECNYARWTKK